MGHLYRIIARDLTEFRLMLIIVTGVMFLPSVRPLEYRTMGIILAAFGFSQMTFSVEWRRRSIVALLSLPLSPRTAIFGKIAAHWTMMLIVVDVPAFFVGNSFYEAFLLTSLGITIMTLFAVLMVCVDNELVPVAPMGLLIWASANYEKNMDKLKALNYFYPAVAGLVLSAVAVVISLRYFEWRLARKGFTSLEGW